MTEAFTPGENVCFVCGSPTFVVLKDPGENKDVILVWFNTQTFQIEKFKAPRIAIITTKAFKERQIQRELEINSRLYEIPEGVPPELTLLVAFATPEHQQEFIEKMFDEEALGQVVTKPNKPSLN